MDPATAYALTQAGVALAGYLSSRNQGKASREQRQLMLSQGRNVDTQTALSQLELARKRQQDPLWRAVQKMAFGSLPTFAQQGLNFDVANPVPELPPDLSRRRERGDREPIGRAMNRPLELTRPPGT